MAELCRHYRCNKMWVLHDFEVHAKAWQGEEHEKRTHFSKKNTKECCFCSWNTWPPCKTQLFGNPVFSRKAYNAVAHSSEMLRTRARQFHAHAPSLVGSMHILDFFSSSFHINYTSMKEVASRNWALLQENPRQSPSLWHTQTAKHQTLTDWITGWKRYWETQDKPFLSTIFPHVSWNWRNSSRHGHGTTVATPPGGVRSSYHHLSPLSCKTVFDVFGQNGPTTLLVNPLRHLQ